MACAADRFDGATHVARLGDHRYYLDADGFDEACERLIRDNGGGQPTVEALEEGGGDEPAGAGVALAPMTQADEDGGRGFSEEGRDRSLADRAALVASGFAPAQPMYDTGTRVVDVGVENARAIRREFDEMQTVGEAADAYCGMIDDEERSSQVVLARDLRMTKGGDVVEMVAGPSGRVARGSAHALTSPAFQSLLGRMGIPGTRYLTQACWPALRALNVNRQMSLQGELEKAAVAEWEETVRQLGREHAWRPSAERAAGTRPAEKRIKLLTRANEKHVSGREVYGAVGPNYPVEFSGMKIAKALAQAAPDGARATVKYDGRRTTIDCLLHTTVRPEEFVAGEFFRVGIRVRTDDTGGGSCVVSGVAWQNLCLNLLCIDESVTGIDRIRHQGSVEELAERLNVAIAKAWASLDHFQHAWGYATREDVLLRTLEVTADEDARSFLEEAREGGYAVEDVLPGFWSAILDRELVPVRGRKKDVVPQLVECTLADESAAAVGRDQVLSRTRIVNGATRWAHEYNADPEVAHEVETAAGRLLFGRVGKGGRRQPPEPLPFSVV